MSAEHETAYPRFKSNLTEIELVEIYTPTNNDGLFAENIKHEQQKTIKYNHLAANMVTLYNEVNMAKVISELIEQRYPIDQCILASLSPFRKGNIADLELTLWIWIESSHTLN